MRSIRERFGEAVGVAIAPLARWVSHRRGARTFHPDGLVFSAEVSAAEGSALGQHLVGDALVRLSGALWKRGPALPDALGVALRILDAGAAPPTADHLEDQDLLFATIISPLTLPFSPFTTDITDFFSNHYWAVAPFDAPQMGRVKLRMSPLQAAEPGDDREARLRTLVEAGRAGFTLEARRTLTLGWEPVAEVRLGHELSLDQAALAFSPFLVGRGLVPRGFVHALRSAVYPASQRGRAEAPAT